EECAARRDARPDARGRGRHRRTRSLADSADTAVVAHATSRSPISLIGLPTLALSTFSTASTDGRWSPCTSTPPHAFCPSCSTVSDRRLPNRFTLLSTPSPGGTVMGPIWTSSCGGHMCMIAIPDVLVTSRSFMEAPSWTARRTQHTTDDVRPALRAYCG